MYHMGRGTFRVRIACVSGSGLCECPLTIRRFEWPPHAIIIWSPSSSSLFTPTSNPW